jgi:hypothetical protein
VESLLTFDLLMAGKSRANHPPRETDCQRRNWVSSRKLRGFLVWFSVVIQRMHGFLGWSELKNVDTKGLTLC